MKIHLNSPDEQVEVIRPTPQHDRLRSVKNLSQSIHEFIHWLSDEKNVILATENIDNDDPQYYNPSRTSLTDLVAEYFEIDLDELENEKRRMLHDIRLSNAKREIEKELPVTKRKSK